MISANPISSGSGAAGYYEKSFTVDGAVQADNYYVNETSQAEWQGKGAEILGIEGKGVTREEFIKFLDGKFENPTTGNVQDLSLNGGSGERRAGWDFTVSAPKSVSMVGLVGGDERVLAAHQSANAQAMKWLEEHASQIRVKDAFGENVRETTGNLLWATVQHETSRSNEPQLHNHNVIIAATFDQEAGKWRSLTNDELFVLRASADSIYKGVLAKELRSAGYELEYSKDHINFEIKGISAEQVEAFSSRSKEINAALRERGLDPEVASWEARQAAALDSRARKQELPRDVVHAVWEEKAKEVGLDISQVVGDARERALSQGESKDQKQAQDRSGAMRAVSWAVEHLSEREQAFKVSALEATAVEFGGAAISDIKEAIAAHLKNHQLVIKDVREDGSVMVTTQKGIESENRLRENIEAGKGNGRAILVDVTEFNTAMAAFETRKTQETGATFKLSGEQINAAKNVLMHGDAYQGIQGEAGTGKTAALEFVREVAEAKGWNVQGVAVSASAAQELQASSGIQSQTLARMFVTQRVAMQNTELEIKSLKSAIASQEPINGSQVSRVQTQKLSAQSADLDFGKNRYTFDHAKGDVYKPGEGFQSKVGSFFLDVSERLKAGAAGDQANTHTLSSKLRAGVADGLGGVGNSLTDLRKVGTVEAIAARNALYEGLDPKRETLQGKLAMKEGELHNLQMKGNIFGSNTLLVMDESSMGGVRDMAKYTTYANSIGARVVLQGDTKQHGSVPAGRAFEQAQRSGMHLSVLEETRRFDKATAPTKAALAEMKIGNFGRAMSALDRTIVDDAGLAKAVAQRYIASVDTLKDRGIDSPKVRVVAVTNTDRKEINKEIQKALQARGMVDTKVFTKEHFDNPNLTPAQLRTVSEMAKGEVDRVIFKKDYKEIGVSKGEVIRVTGFDISTNRINGLTEAGNKVSINPDKQDLFVAARLETREYAVGDQVETRASIKNGGEEIRNGTKGTIEHINQESTAIKWSDGTQSVLGNKAIADVDLAYARTSFKEQGATNDREIIALSTVGAKVFNREAAYVSATRAKDNTELVTSDMERVVKNAGNMTGKTVATSMGGNTGYENPKMSFDDAISKAVQGGKGAGEPAKEITQSNAKDQQVAKNSNRPMELGM